MLYDFPLFLIPLPKLQCGALPEPLPLIFRGGVNWAKGKKQQDRERWVSELQQHIPGKGVERGLLLIDRCRNFCFTSSVGACLMWIVSHLFLWLLFVLPLLIWRCAGRWFGRISENFPAESQLGSWKNFCGGKINLIYLVQPHLWYLHIFIWKHKKLHLT